jgi:GST-like protein
MYLGNKVGRFFPQEPRQRANVTQWLMWQMAGFGPMLGQAHHFFNAAPQQIPYAQNRYHREAQRLYKVLDTQLTTHEYVAGEYSIADMTIYPWVAARKAQRIELIDYPHVQRWVDLLKQRPALQRGFGVGRE